MAAITLGGFEATFAGDDDPWDTLSDSDEAVKRAAIIHALGAPPIGRLLELGAGNGSNSGVLARRALRIDATEATEAGLALMRRNVVAGARVTIRRLIVPERFPRARYDAIVIAELLYYLEARAMATLARRTAAALAPDGRLVLAQHRIDFHDFAQHAEGIHDRFLMASGVSWRRRVVRRTGRWIVEAAERWG